MRETLRERGSERERQRERQREREREGVREGGSERERERERERGSLFELCNNIDVKNVFDHKMFSSLKLPFGYLHCFGYMEIVYTIMFHCDKCSNSVFDKLINTLQI